MAVASLGLAVLLILTLMASRAPYQADVVMR